MGGGLALIWKEGVVIDLINFTAHHILVKVKEEDGFEWWLACFYGWPEANMRSGDANTKLKLDRAVATKDWCDKFQLSSVTHLPPHEFYHLPIVLQTEHLKPRKGRKGFKFEENWLLWEECEEVMLDAWATGEIEGHRLEMIQHKIKTCSEVLRAWGSAKTYPNTDEIKQLQKMLEVLNIKETTEESRAEYLGRSRVAWLKHGDKNTKFFHSNASQRRRRNHIQGIKNSDGAWLEEEEEIAEVAADYFDNLFNASTCTQTDDCLNTVPHKLTPEMQQTLTSDFTTEEIKVALFQMGPTKAPGLDDMNALFFQKL
ncbi:uncharacterized protein LOC142620549 [Castanea sativa]|uniref:uncharacterized protein LOC142620549 n=1 Tax=Castanea sativa TaxID=21020 RepID=UPI003F64E04C